MYQMKEQDKIPEKQLNEVERVYLTEKRTQNNDSEDDPGPREKKWRQRLRRCKKCLTKT